MKDQTFEKMSQFGQDLLIKAKKSFGQAEVIIESGTGVTIQFDSGKLTTIDKTNGLHVGLRIIHKGRVGVTGTVKPVDIDRLLKEAEVSSANSDKAFFSFPNHPNLPAGRQDSQKALKTFSEEVVVTSVEKVIADGKLAIKELHNTVPDFLPRFLIASWSWGQTRLLNSHGLDLQKSGTHTDLTVDLSRIKEGDFFELWEPYTSRRWEKNFLSLTKILEQKVNWGKKTVPVDPGSFTVVFPPKTIDMIVEYFETAVNGQEVNDKSSRFVGKLGQKLFDPRITLVNSPLEDWRPGSESFDDEGVVTSPQNLIDKGILKSFVYDLQEAGRAKTSSTGSGARGSIFRGIKPATSNLMLTGGDKPWAKILAGIKKGILVDYFVGSGQGNEYNGDFSLSVAPGFLIDNGEIAGRVKGVGLAGNIFDLLKDNLIELSRETEWNGSLCAPYIVFSGINVTSKS